MNFRLGQKVSLKNTLNWSFAAGDPRKDCFGIINEVDLHRVYCNVYNKDGSAHGGFEGLDDWGFEKIYITPYINNNIEEDYDIRDR